MGILDDLKHKAEELGERAKEGLDVARDKAGDLVDDVKERLGQHEGDHAPTSESADVGPDSSSTDAVQPGYVTGEDETEASPDADSSLTDDAEAEAEAESDSGSGSFAADDDTDVVEEEGLAASFAADGATSTETDAAGAEPAADAGPDVADTVDPAGAEGVDHPSAGADAADEPLDDDPQDAGPRDVGPQDVAAQGGGEAGEGDDAPLDPVATDVDPYDQPLSESIGDELSDADRAALAQAVDDGSTGPDA